MNSGIFLLLVLGITMHNVQTIGGRPNDENKDDTELIWENGNVTNTNGDSVEIEENRGAQYSDPVKACVWGYTNKRLSDVSLEECKEKCVTESFGCKALEYRESSKNCWLSKDTKKSQPSSYQQPCGGSYSDLIYLEKTVKCEKYCCSPDTDQLMERLGCPTADVLRCEFPGMRMCVPRFVVIYIQLSIYSAQFKKVNLCTRLRQGSTSLLEEAGC